jgi:anti-sigma factor (TIGR02949 family)
MSGDCDKCEKLLQGYLDRELSQEEVEVAEMHLDECDYCRRRYRFEASLRQYVRTTAVERMPPGLMAKLTQLRTTDPGASASL